MTSTAGAIPPPTTTTTTPLCVPPTATSMVSSQPFDDEDRNQGAIINGGSPPETKISESSTPPPMTLSHMVCAVVPPITPPPRPSSPDTEEGPLLETLDDEDQPPGEDIGPSHADRHQPRNKRKNFKPRNIVYHFSDNEYGEGSSDDGDTFEDTSDLAPSRSSPIGLSPECRSACSPSFDDGIESAEGSTQPLDLSSDTSTSRRKLNSKNPRKDVVQATGDNRNFNPVNLSVRDGNNEIVEEKERTTPVMDLSRSGREGPIQDFESSPVHWSSGGNGETKGQNSPTNSRPHFSFSPRETDKHPAAGDGGTMKDYAENTMKELLGMYGLNDSADALSNHLPFPNFHPGKLVENLPPNQLACLAPVNAYTSGSSLHLLHQQAAQMDFLNQARAAQMPKEPSSHLADTPWQSVVEQNSIPNLSQPLPRSSEGVFESLRTKMMDNMSRISSLTGNHIIPNPQVMMPQNMATIFTIAALSSKIPQSQHSSESISTIPSNSTSSMSPHHNNSTSIMGTLSSTPSPVVSSSPHNSAVTTSSGYRLDQHQKLGPVDYTRYVKRFSNASECGSNYCKGLNYREHFHCLDCNSRVFIKKEEMIRHFKWHKKRDDSLQYGFMRYSSVDDCSDKFRDCSHNKKQTHYHCLKESCDKVYISTSDVQMHANYHRKDSAIIQEGFQRFRATENCATASCLFFGQRTTHFHCRRSGCSFTFKNKADMEKHKTYHIKDEQLNKDGFKKFMKHEHCSFENCRFSRVCNHIHCIRPGCTYVLHSSGQLYSHKRKHERRDTELAYRKYKLAQSMIKSLSEAGGLPQAFLTEPQSSGESSSSPAPGPLQLASPFGSQLNSCNFYPDDSSVNDFFVMKQEKGESGYNMSNQVERKNTSPSKFVPIMNDIAQKNLSTIADSSSGPSEDLSVVDLSMEHQNDSDDLWKTYLTRYGVNEACQPQCEYLYKDHFHCVTDNCTMTFRAKDIMGVKEHACNHENQEQVTKSFYTIVEINQNGACPSDCHFKAKEKHYHCKWENCQEVISGDDNPFRRLDHYKIHKYSRKLSAPKEQSSYGSSISSNIDNMFRRKRGRPPKNRMIEFPMGSSQLPQAIYTSFKLPKSSELSPQGFTSPFGSFTSTYGTMPLFPPPVTMIATSSSMPQLIPVTGLGSNIFPPNNAFQVSSPTDKSENFSVVPSIKQEIQDQPVKKPEVQEGFYVFSENMSCPDKLCAFHGQNHYHCTQPRCYYVTDRSDILLLHSKDFHDNIDILDGFVFFDRSVDCRLPGCHSNKINRHFHCVRSNCNYSFVRYSTMTIHDQKHREHENGNFLPASPKKKCFPSVTEEDNANLDNSASLMINITSSESLTQPKTTVVKAAGTFYPLSAFSSNQSSRNSPTSQNPLSVPSHQFLHTDEKNNKEKNDIKNENIFFPGMDITEQPLSHLLQQPGPVSKNNLQGREKHILYSPQQSCGRPFCKLKKRDHFHCNICNQAFAGFSLLHAHVITHVGALSPTPVYPPGYTKLPSPTSSIEDEDCTGQGDFSDSEEHSPRNGPNNATLEENRDVLDDHQVSSSQLFNWQSTSSSPHQSAIKCNIAVSSTNNIGHLTANSDTFYGSPQVDFTSLIDATDDQPKVMDLKRPYMGKLDDSAEIKKMKIAALRILKDEPIPEGYTRCRFNEDCGYPLCGYREHQTHFHCMRKDCGYSFCDKTRFVQHTARHERLDTLMGGDFQQYRANVNCGRGECMYANTLGAMANKSSHFHCLKCDFVCTDTNKVVAHRRQHAKMDSIYAAGFEKYTPFQSCNVEGCNHNQKQTHYHCLKCQYAVLGLSQMSSHKYRHMEC